MVSDIQCLGTEVSAKEFLWSEVEGLHTHMSISNSTGQEVLFPPSQIAHVS